MGEISGMQLRHEILQGMDILQVVPVVVSALQYSSRRDDCIERIIREHLLTFQWQVDTSFLQQSEAGSVADRVHGRSEFSGLV